MCIRGYVVTDKGNGECSGEDVSSVRGMDVESKERSKNQEIRGADRGGRSSQLVVDTIGTLAVNFLDLSDLAFALAKLRCQFAELPLRHGDSSLLVDS